MSSDIPLSPSFFASLFASDPNLVIFSSFGERRIRPAYLFHLLESPCLLGKTKSLLLCLLQISKNSIIFAFMEKNYLVLRMNSRHKKLLTSECQEKKPITCIIEFQLFSFPSQRSYFLTFVESRCSCSSSSRCSSSR